MTDFYKLKDVFEMAEVLSYESDNTLEIATVDATTDQTCNVVFTFNEELELTEVYVEH